MRVAAAKVDSYNYEEVESGVAEVLSLLGGMEKFINAGDRVLIKPNMLEGVSPDKAVTTHPEVIRAIIRAVTGAGGTALVGDSPGTSTTVKAAEKCGILAVCQDEGAELVPFDSTIEVPFLPGLTVKNFSLARPLQEADKVISVAKMKTHSFMDITGATKNLFGFIVGMQKAQFHLRMKARRDFAGMILDLANLIKPVLSIVDGVVGMEGKGPRNGKPIHAGIILAGANCFAVDVVMAEMMGFNLEQTPITALAVERNLTLPFAGIDVVGNGRDCRFNFARPRSLNALEDKVPRWATKIGRNQFTARPEIEFHCIGCGRCAAHCPPKAMMVRNDRVYIDYDKCIRCYCCQELCPENAVRLVEGRMLKLARRLF